MSDVNLLYTEVEDDLRSTVRDILRDRVDPAVVTGVYDGQPGPEGLWTVLAAEVGLAGLLIPERLGGAGASEREAAVVLEELGRTVAPVPFLTSAVVATTVLVEAGSELVKGLASGERTAAVVVPFSTAPECAPQGVSIAGNQLTGQVRGVAGALEADLLLVPVSGEDGVDVYAVEASAATVTPVVSLDMTRPVADVALDGSRGELVVSGARGRSAVRRGLLAGAGLLASEQVGLAQWCLETTIDYLTMRSQFGRVVGGFQALKHRLADLFVEVESAAAAARYAAAALAEGSAALAEGHENAEIAATVAQAFCSDAAVHVAEETIQLHGGIGMTWEHPAHLYLKRAKADQIAFGTAGRQRTRLAALVDLPPAVG